MPGLPQAPPALRPAAPAHAACSPGSAAACSAAADCRALQACRRASSAASRCRGWSVTTACTPASSTARICDWGGVQVYPYGEEFDCVGAPTTGRGLRAPKLQNPRATLLERKPDFTQQEQPATGICTMQSSPPWPAPSPCRRCWPSMHARAAPPREASAARRWVPGTRAAVSNTAQSSHHTAHLLLEWSCFGGPVPKLNRPLLPGLSHNCFTSRCKHQA